VIASTFSTIFKVSIKYEKNLEKKLSFNIIITISISICSGSTFFIGILYKYKYKIIYRLRMSFFDQNLSQRNVRFEEDFLLSFINSEIKFSENNDFKRDMPCIIF
jgi:hypothetical protein